MGATLLLSHAYSTAVREKVATTMSRFLVLFVTVMGCAHHAFAYDCGQLGSSHCGRDPWSPKGKCTWLGGTDGCVSAKSCSSWDANAAECRAAYPTFKSSKNSAQCRHDGSSCSNPPACNTSPYKDSEAQCKNTQGACKWDGGACKASLSSTKVCTCSNGQKVDTCTDSNKPCKNCNAGFKLSSGTCQACAAATHHQTSGQFTGSSCTAHTDCTANIQQQKTAPTATTDRVCECTAGYERKPGSNTCTKLPRRTSRPRPGIKLALCTAFHVRQLATRLSSPHRITKQTACASVAIP